MLAIAPRAGGRMHWSSGLFSTSFFSPNIPNDPANWLGECPTAPRMLRALLSRSTTEPSPQAYKEFEAKPPELTRQGYDHRHQTMCRRPLLLFSARIHEPPPKTAGGFSGRDPLVPHRAAKLGVSKAMITPIRSKVRRSPSAKFPGRAPTSADGRSRRHGQMKAINKP